MKLASSFRVLPMACALCALLVSTPATADCDSLDALSWMAGNWSTRGGASRISERWVRVSADTAEGVGEVHSRADGVLKSRETLRLVSMSGGIYFVAKVGHNPLPVAFALTACDERLAVFENPDHDFPNRIAYQLNDAGELLVEVAGQDGKGFEILFEALPPEGPRIALTFDDAPRGDSRLFSGEQRTRRLLHSLASVNAPPAIFFSVGSRVDNAGTARLEAYQAVGHYIANHSHTHQRINGLGVDGYIADIREAHEALSGFENFVPLFRYPFLDEGRDADTRARLGGALTALGYRNGYVTIDNYDWYMDAILQRALEQGREVDYGRLGDAYVRLMMDAVDFYRDIGDQYLDEAPVHVLLLHENDLAAMFVDELVTALRVAGWTIVDATEAYREPNVLAAPDTLFTGQGRVAAIADSKGAARRELVHPSEDTAFLERAFEKAGAFLPPTPWQPEDGDLLYSANHEGNSEIYFQPAGQAPINLSRHEAGDNYPVWSPDGRHIAFQSDRSGKLDIYLVNDDGSGLRRLTEHPAHDYLPSWTPDGAHITFVSRRQEPRDDSEDSHIYIMNADGSEQRRLVEETYGTSATIAWSPHVKGRSVRTLKTSEFGADLFVAGEEGEVIHRLTDDGRYNSAPDYSPTADRIAFHSEQDSASSISVIGADGKGRRGVVSYGTNWYPHWSPDGCWLVYTAQVSSDEPGNLDIRAIRSDGSNDWRVLVGGPGRQAEASWRPLAQPSGVRCD